MITDAPFWNDALMSPDEIPGVDLLSVFVPLFASGGASTKELTSTINSHEPFGGDREKGSSASLDLSQFSEQDTHLLQHVLMYMNSMDELRYTVPAMSAGKNGLCVIERHTNNIISYGSGVRPSIVGDTEYISCVCGDTYVALLTSNHDVVVAGQLDGHPSEVRKGTAELKLVANKVKQLAGNMSRLVGLSLASTVRPISIVAAMTKTLIPYRHCHFLATGLHDDCLMIGDDNLLYKTTASTNSVGTPRRIMTLSRIGVSRVAGGSGFTFVIDLSGRLFSFGKNKQGQLGCGKAESSVRKPYLHQNVSHHFFVNVSCGERHAIAQTSSGAVYGCGSNEYGQLGLGADVRQYTTLTKIPLPTRCTGICAGPSTSFFATADGCVYGCGANEGGMVGVRNANTAGSSRSSTASSAKKEMIVNTPTKVPGISHGVEEIVLGGAGGINSHAWTQRKAERLHARAQRMPKNGASSTAINLGASEQPGDRAKEEDLEAEARFEKAHRREHQEEIQHEVDVETRDINTSSTPAKKGTSGNEETGCSCTVS